MYFHDGQGRGWQVFLGWAVDVCVYVCRLSRNATTVTSWQPLVGNQLFQSIYIIYFLFTSKQLQRNPRETAVGDNALQVVVASEVRW